MTHTVGTFRIRMEGWPDRAAILIAAGTCSSCGPRTSPCWFPLPPFDVGAAVAIVGLLATFVTSAISNTRILYQREPLPAAPGAAQSTIDTRSTIVNKSAIGNQQSQSAVRNLRSAIIINR